MIPPSASTGPALDSDADDLGLPDDALRLHLIIGAHPPARLDKAIARDAPEAAALSRMRIARAIAEGAVRSLTSGQVLTRPSARVAEGEEIEIVLEAPEAPENLIPEAMDLVIVHEDADLIVIDKPAGMVVHPAPGAARGTLANALLYHCGPDLMAVGGTGRPGIVHRIDKDTTGLLVAAKTERAHRILSAQFAEHSVQRRYLALTHGLPDPGDPRLRGLRGIAMEAGGVIVIRTGLDRHPGDRQRQAVTFSGGRAAVTRARAEGAYGTPPSLALVSCWLETGRTHQIRVHLAYAGHPLVGDQTYGTRRRAAPRSLGEAGAALVDAFPRQALHAATLGFDHPTTGARMHFESPLPPDFTDLLARLPAVGGAQDR